MVRIQINLRNAVAALAAFAAVASVCGAQTGPCGDPLYDNGLGLRDLSRNVSGFAGEGAATVVYFTTCGSSGDMLRNTLYQPFTMNLARQGTDEVPELNVTLTGQYSSVRRMNDLHPNFDPATNPNPRIGYEYASGNVIDVTGKVIGTFALNGNIATDSCRPPLPDGIGKSYDCSHHAGYVTLTFTAGPLKGQGAVFAEYHFHTGDSASQCDLDDPCNIMFQYWGAVDGEFLTRCGYQTPPAGVAAKG
ncbi:MAG TPA: hypothetical protein VGM37_16935 [Armatimonadota bacterium]|jgi:hypothetical protein